MARRQPTLQDLYRFRIHDILLVSTMYDSFMLSEDGQLSEAILREFVSVDPHDLPAITRVSTGAQARRVIRTTPPDLVVASMQIGDMSAADLAKSLRREGFNAPLVALAHDARDLEDVHAGPPPGFDRVFLWQGDFRILPAIVKDVEDRMNVATDTGTLGVQAMIVIEDNVRFYSSFLPAIYSALLQHSEGLAPEGLNVSQRLLRIRARPKVLLCHCYEDAWRYFERYQDHILGVISDMEFPRDGELRLDSGLRFAEMVRARQPDIPVMLQSARRENEVLAHEAAAAFIFKDSPTLLHDIQRFMYDNFGFGDFVFRRPNGEVVVRARNLRALEEQLHVVPADSIAYHAERNHFSSWLKARTEFELAYRLRPRKLSDFETVEGLREELIRSIQEHRRRLNRGVVAQFDAEGFDPETSFCRIGAGSVGAKGRGLALVNQLVADHELEDAFPGVRVTVPPAVVLATEVFDEFLRLNNLADFALRCSDDQELLRMFSAASLPADVTDRLAAYLAVAMYPLAVRSSSLLEDSRYQPFAGVYDTWMLANAGESVTERLAELERAIKRVFASTFCHRAKTYLAASPYRLEEEKMAVVVQKVVGARHAERYYPDIAGVARSFNFYPLPPAVTDDGIASVALGLGAAVVDGDVCFQFSPRHPSRPAQFLSVDQLLTNSQREFFALRLDGSPTTDGPERYTLDAAERDGTLAWLGSTYSEANHALYDGVSRPGTRVVTFAPILKHGVFPLAEILTTLLGICSAATSTPVEIEFAATLSTPAGEPKEFGFLQVRPVAVARELSELEIGDLDPARIVCSSSVVLGHGKHEGIRDLIVIDIHRFERARSRDVALDVARLTAPLSAEGVPYILIGVGRWGSTEPFLGIPVTWDQISGARVIVEAGFRDFRVTPSQGSHFFQNLTARNVGYFTVNPEAGEGFVDWNWLAAQPAAAEAGVVRHLRLAEPVLVKMNGRKQQGVILKPNA